MSTINGTKIAVITGAAGNLGAAVAAKFVAEGYTVIGTVTKSGGKTNNDKTFSEAALDLTDEAATAAFVAAVIAEHGKIDVLVATVGGFAMADIANTSTADILQQYKLNFETAYNIARPVFTNMLQHNSGRVFLIGSKPGLSAANGKGMVAYGLSKSLIFRLAELMNAEAKGTDVVTGVIVPGTIDTPQNREAMKDADHDTWVTPAAIADAVYFYCTDAAKAIMEPVIKLYNKG